MRTLGLVLAATATLTLGIVIDAWATPPPQASPGQARVAPPPGPVAGTEGDPLDGAVALAPIRDGSLTVIPLVAAKLDADVPSDMLVLDEAMQKNLVRVREVDDSGSVNQLRLTNQADKPLFLLAGEVVIGGKQDRIIGSNTIIPPKSTLDVPVFCVERGRWSGDGSKKEFKTAGALAHGRLRGKASFDGQGDVWAEVGKKNAERGTTSDTDTYRGVAAQQVQGTIAEREKRLRNAVDAIPKADRERLVGYAVAINGAIATVDLFGSPVLLKKLEPKLLRSYLTEAIDVKEDVKAPVPARADFSDFMVDAASTPEAPAYSTDAADTSNAIGTKAARQRVKTKTRSGKAAKVFENYTAR